MPKANHNKEVMHHRQSGYPFDVNFVKFLHVLCSHFVCKMAFVRQAWQVYKIYIFSHELRGQTAADLLVRLPIVFTPITMSCFSDFDKLTARRSGLSLRVPRLAR
jgi:hypothetical protein